MKHAHTDEPITVPLKPLMRERKLTFRASLAIEPGYFRGRAGLGAGGVRRR